MGIRRKVSEISGVCLFLLTHLNHELTRAAHELRVWLKAAKYEIQKPSTCRATLFRCKFWSMFRVFHLA